MRVITPQAFALFDRELNEEWQRTKRPNTSLAHYLGVDFKPLVSRTMVG